MHTSGTDGSGRKTALLKTEVSIHADFPVAQIKAALGSAPLALLTLFVSSEADFQGIVAAAEQVFPDVDVVACTTAGEIGERGYDEGMIVALGYPAEHFSSCSILIDELDVNHAQSVVDRVALDRVHLQTDNPDKRHGFGFLVVDGLSLREDTLTAAIAPAMRDLQLFGGSAGDGTRFEKTYVSLNGQVRDNAAVLTLVQTDLIAKVFSIDHLEPQTTQMVVTEAEPDKRIVKSINAEPAAREYARIVGKNPDALDQFTFASHPVVVRIGGSHHVRAIQRVTDEESLVFFSAIDEGMVLTVAEPHDIAAHLDRSLHELAAGGSLMDIVGCDCILRRIEAEQKQVTLQMSQVLRKHQVVGFSTYGEQIGPLHVNHTMTGVAFFEPASERVR